MSQLSPDGFSRRFTACSRSLWCIAVAILGDLDPAEDVLQEAALTALGKLHQFDPATTFTAWMGQIVRYTALNHARRRARTSTSVDPTVLDETAAPPPVAGPLGLTGRGQLARDQGDFDDDVMAALSELDHPARECLLLRVVLDMPYRDIARALDLPEGTAMSHVHRARRLLRDRLSTPTPSAEVAP